VERPGSAGSPRGAFHLAGYGVDRDETDEQKPAESMSWRCGRCRRGRSLGKSGLAGSPAAPRGLGPGVRVSGANLDEGAPARPTTVYGKTKLEGNVLLMERGGHPNLERWGEALHGVRTGRTDGSPAPSLCEAAERGRPIALTAARSAGLHLCRRCGRRISAVGVCERPAGDRESRDRPPPASCGSSSRSRRRSFGLAAERLNFGALPTPPGEMGTMRSLSARLRQLTAGGSPAEHRRRREGRRWPTNLGDDMSTVPGPRS